MKNKRLRAAVAVFVLVATIAAFVYYFTNHPEQVRQLGRVSPWLLVVLFGLYGLIIASLVYVLAASLRIIGVRIRWRENFLLTSYSSIINFFGPLQSGPGVRLLYLKQKYGVSVKSFAFATFLYYGFFALFSGLFLVVHVLPWWQTLLVAVCIAGGSWLVISRKRKQADAATPSRINTAAIANLALATLCQVLLVAVLYFVELRSIDPDVSFAQAVTYTGAANFALFVSLTPGAIGFRESFLLFSQQLHGIEAPQVLAASLIDRTVNVAFLGLLFLVTLGLHARERLHVKSLTAKAADE